MGGPSRLLSGVQVAWELRRDCSGGDEAWGKAIRAMGTQNCGSECALRFRMGNYRSTVQAFHKQTHLTEGDRFIIPFQSTFT